MCDFFIDHNSFLSWECMPIYGCIYMVYRTDERFWFIFQAYLDMTSDDPVKAPKTETRTKNGIIQAIGPR